MVQGDRTFAHYKNAQYQHQDAAIVLSNCIRSYENDLVDGTLPFEDFVRKVNVVQKEMVLVSKVKKPHGNYVSMNHYPFDDEQLNHIGNQLMRKRNIDDAIKVFKLSVENYPNSISAYDSLGRAYKMLGKPELALKYKDKYNKLSKGEKLSP
jgi:tetratricopeptide (TPR) repeat protein